MKKASLDELETRFLEGDRRLLARMISKLEREEAQAREFLQRCYPHLSGAFRIGITGPPGCGKSTLVDGLVSHLRQKNLSLGIVAVDPSSIFSGGALLGDRVRMGRIGNDDGVFMRSMATRGSLGGLAETTGDVCHLLDAFGFDWILIETVGVGQLEMDIVAVADLVVVVLSPEGGDEIQASKAGIMEVGDIYVVNKGDRPGADEMKMEVEYMLHRKNFSPDQWKPPVIKTSASREEGLEEVVEALFKGQKFWREKGKIEAKRRDLMADKLRRQLLALPREILEKDPDFQKELKKGLEEIYQGKVSWSQACDDLYQKLLSHLSQWETQNKGI